MSPLSLPCCVSPKEGLVGRYRVIDVSNEPSYQLDPKTMQTMVACMLDLNDVFQLIIHSLDEGKLPEDEFISQTG